MRIEAAHSRYTSSMLSRLCESEPCIDTSGRMSVRSGSSGDFITGPRASAQLRLASMVLISPLCASIPEGCASFHCGSVLVEKRWWNTATEASTRSSPRSGKNSTRCAGITMPL